MNKVLIAAVSRIGDSKTYVLLILMAILAFGVCIMAAAIFGQHLWDRFFDLLMADAGAAATRAVAVDGIPKVAAAVKDPNSQAANPASAMLEIVPPESGPPPPPEPVAPPAARSSIFPGGISP